MKTFVVPSWYPTENRPLWANWILPHVAALRENGVDAYVIQVDLDGGRMPTGTSPQNQSPRFFDDKHLYVPLPLKKGRYHRTRFFYGPILRQYTEKLQELYDIAVDRWGQPDVIHAHVSLPAGYGAAKLGNDIGVPVIVTEHYTGFESDAKFWWRTGCFVREMGHRIKGFYAVSPGFAERILRTGLVDVTGVLPNPIDTTLFRPVPGENSSKYFRIVTVGNTGWRKGTDVLFEALNQLWDRLDWSLTLFGNVRDRAIYARWLDDPEFAKRISLSGKVSQKDLLAEYSNSDLYVVSSRVETANVSMLEAMACGVPVVTTRCKGPESLIDASVGVSVQSNNPTALAKGILEVAENRSRYDPAKLRKFVEDRYSTKAVVGMMMEAYDKAIEKAK